MMKLEEGEVILYVARRHWFLFLGETLFLVFFAVAPLGLFMVPAWVATDIFSSLGIVNHISNLFIFFWSLWLLFLWTMFALRWTNYYLDVWVLTNNRIFDINQIGLFNRNVSSFRFDQIQDATVKVSGLLGTLIGFGTVVIRTASNASFSFEGVANPDSLKERIMTEHHRVHTG